MAKETPLSRIHLPFYSMLSGGERVTRVIGTAMVVQGEGIVVILFDEGPLVSEMPDYLHSVFNLFLVLVTSITGLVFFRIPLFRSTDYDR